MRVERCRAVRADDPEVLETVVVRNPIDVIEDQRHRASVPQLVLTADLAMLLFQPRLEQPFLHIAAAAIRVFDK